MTTPTILNVLHILLGRRSSDEKCSKEGIENWAKKVFQGYRQSSFKEERLDIERPKRKLSDISESDLKDNVESVLDFLKNVHVATSLCRFNVPQVRTRIEKLMGTNCVSLTDRDYMQKLQHRILEDYGEQMEKRIKVREEDEMERVKNLVLVGKIPLDQAPPEMAHHPMMLIENYCNQLIAERRAKIKIYKVKIPTYLYWDDTPDPPSRLSIESEHLFRQVEKFYKPLESTDDENIEGGYVAPQKDYDRIRYESPLIKQLMICETVEEMYALADDIIGALKTINETTKVIPDGVLETGD
ncbi:uncharacterized protein [Euwallacea fornicatus]|uniref:uncharacterized protein isoform X2 n=1 Tax=Euwallacea fornicatus TaxID=995702 RepID=UPI00338E7AF6